MKTLIAAALAALALAGCQTKPTGIAQPKVPAGPLTAQLKAEGDALAAQGRHLEASVKYQTAVNKEPGNIPLRYALGVTLSHLDRSDEAAEHLKVVVARGPAGSEEVRLAREWLLAAGEAAAAAAQRAEKKVDKPKDAPDKGKLFGAIRWQGIDPRGRLITVRVSLEGDDPTTFHERHSRDGFKIGRSYEFHGLVPGRYRLVAENAGTRMWEQVVTVTAGKQTTLDLTDANAAVPKAFEPREES
jgi:tetratricopeptide (TPR) repeat protein